jgi:hypothetical protein
LQTLEVVLNDLPDRLQFLKSLDCGINQSDNRVDAKLRR